MRKYNDKDIIEYLVDSTTFIGMILLFLLALIMSTVVIISQELNDYLIVLGIPIAIIIFIIILYIYTIIFYNNENNWYISKEKITITRVISESREGTSDFSFILFDNKAIRYKRFSDCYYGDTIYVIRKSTNNKPVYVFLENEFEYIGSKGIIDNTYNYNNEYYYENSLKKRTPVNKDTYEVSNGNRFMVGKKTKNDKESIIISILLVSFIFISFLIIAFIISNDSSNGIKNAWINTTGTIENREIYSTPGKNKYKYEITYDINGEKYRGYIISTHGSKNDINKKIAIYVNPSNFKEVKIDKWKTFK